MNKKALIVLSTIVIVAVVAVVGGAFALQHKSSAASSCVNGTKSITHNVTIKNDKATPSLTNATLCDKLTITNEDNETREIAFGPHEEHVPYDGVAEKTLRQGQTLTVTLNKAGTYRVHDHFHDEVSAQFVVTP